MHYSTIKTVLEARPTSDPMVLDYNGSTKKWSLAFPKHAATANLLFVYLGGGSNKLVFRVLQGDKPTEWVVCLQSVPGATNAKASITSEMAILQRLAVNKVAVPRPFGGTAKEADLLLAFEVDNRDSDARGVVYGFFQEYFDLQSAANPKGRFVEMWKADGNLLQWLKQTALGPERNPSNLERTAASFRNIKAAWSKPGGPWGDFQVIYDTQTGILITFDPYSDLGNVHATEKILKQWEADLEEALNGGKKVQQGQNIKSKV